MRIFVAGGSGAVGSRLIPLLAEAGHTVFATTRRPIGTRRLYELGAQPVVMDGLDRAEVEQAVTRADPEVVIHQMTALSDFADLKHFDRGFAVTNRLRTVGTDNLLAAAEATGVRRVIAQSFGNWNYERVGSSVKSEEARLDPDPPAAMRTSLAAIAHLESAITGSEALEGIALRYANLYGPGTSWSEDGAYAEMVRRRRMPIAGDGAGVWSFLHVDDAASATIAAVERGAPGIYNVADDEPATVAVWLPEVARALGAKAPRRIPRWLARIAVGDVGVSLFTQIRGAANAKAKRELEWQPAYSSWRDGFRRGLTDTPAESLRQLRTPDLHTSR